MYTFLCLLLAIGGFKKTTKIRAINLFKKIRILPNFVITIDPKWDIPVDTKHANMIIKITPKGIDHYILFMQYPRFGPFTD
jgi:hypothetical protein